MKGSYQVLKEHYLKVVWCNNFFCVFRTGCSVYFLYPHLYSSMVLQARGGGHESGSMCYFLQVSSTSIMEAGHRRTPRGTSCRGSSAC